MPRRRRPRKGLAKLIKGFEDGKVSAEEFNAVLSNQLAPALSTIARKNLGLTIEQDFLRKVEALRKQAEALSGFLGRPGTEPGPYRRQTGDNAGGGFREDRQGAERSCGDHRRRLIRRARRTLDEQKIQTALLRRTRRAPQRRHGQGL